MVVFSLPALGLIAQNKSTTNKEESGQQNKQTNAVIKRQPVILKDPRSYRIPLRLKPSRSIALTAPVDGVVRSVHVKAGESLPVQGDVVRLDATREELLVNRAKVLMEAREIERKLVASQGEADAIALADANRQAAKIDLNLAQLNRERMVVRGPFAGTILRVHVVAGQFVRAGEPLVELADITRLRADIPVDRARAKLNTSINITIENSTAKATVVEIRPADQRFEPLRDLVDSLATATVAVDNKAANFQPGQAVYVRLIPDNPVVVVPSEAVSNQENGTRKVQVVRDYVVRDVKIEPLAQIGTERIYVAGLFGAGDEVVVSSTTELRDGMHLVPQTEKRAREESETKQKRGQATLGSGSSQPRNPGGKSKGF